MGVVRMQFSSEDAQAVRSFMKLENRTQALHRKQKRLNRASSQMSQKGKRGTKQWINRLGQVATAYFGVYTAINQAREAFRAYNEERQQAAQSREKSYGGFRELGQLAENRKDLRRMIRSTRQTMAETGMNRQEAGKLQFMLESAGRADMRGMYTGLSTITDPLQMASSVSTLQNALGKGETGTDKAIVDKLFRASKTAKATVSEIASGTTRAAQSAKGVGATDEELLASIAIGSKGEESVERVATRVAAMAKQAEEKDILPTEEGLLGVVRAAQKLEKSGKAANEIFTSQRALQGYRLMRDNMERITKLSGEIGQTGRAAAATEGLFGAQAARKINLVRQEFGATIQGQRIQQEGSIVNEMMRGREEKQRRNIIELYDTLQQQSGVNFAQRYIRRKMLGTYASAGMSDEGLLKEIAGIDTRAAGIIARRLGYQQTGEGFLGPGEFTKTGPGAGLMVDEPDQVNVQSDVPGTKVEHQVTVKDQRSPQQSRMGGAAGVE